MELNMTTLRGILATILSVDSKYVVPKQGNWWNPQDKQSNIANWCAYRIKSNRPVTSPFYDEEDEQNKAVILKQAEIELQFVGPKSEDLANSVAFWSLRSDVQEQFKSVQGAILYDDCAAISSFFVQDGNNTVMAWNTTFSVNWYSQQPTGQGKMPFINFEGK